MFIKHMITMYYSITKIIRTINMYYSITIVIIIIIINMFVNILK